MDSAKNLCRQIQSAGKRLSKKQLVAGSDGNISVRLDQERILITPSGLRLDDLDTDDIVMLSLDGLTASGQHKPSSEAAAHLHFYRERPDIEAVVHAHPPYVTAYAVAGVVPEWRALPEMVVLVGPVAHTPYAPPGTSQVPDALRPFTPDHNAFVLSNHGLITIGRSLDQAMARIEHVEHSARILYLSKFLGAPQRLPESELERLEALRRSLQEQPDSRTR
jgi:L-fuculose-phosphate aldolase